MLVSGLVNQTLRYDGRAFNRVREITLTPSFCKYADGSVLVQMGATKVICTVTMNDGVPLFLRGKNSGWATAEYFFMPYASEIKNQRASGAHTALVNNRSVEISRLIGRCLRTVLDLAVIPDKTLYIDCTVLQADGGTRTASIAGAFVALVLAQRKLLTINSIEHPFLKEQIGAVSVGIKDNHIFLDPTYQEETMLDADINFILLRSGAIVEIQGGAERVPFSNDLFTKALAVASDGIIQWFEAIDLCLGL